MILIIRIPKCSTRDKIIKKSTRSNNELNNIHIQNNKYNFKTCLLKTIFIFYLTNICCFIDCLVINSFLSFNNSW